MKMSVDLIIPDILLAMHKICIDEANKIDPQKTKIKGGLYSIADLCLEFISGNIKKRYESVVKEDNI